MSEDVKIPVRIEGLPPQAIVDAEGRFLGVAAGARRHYRRRDPARDEFREIEVPALDDGGAPMRDESGHPVIVRVRRLAKEGWRDETEDEAPAIPEGATLVDAVPADARAIWEGTRWIEPPPRWPVPKLAIIERLHAAGRLVAANAALNGAGSADAILLAERWYQAREVWSDDARARQFLAAIGADPDAILARPA